MSIIPFLKKFAENLSTDALFLAVLVVPLLILITIVGLIFRRSRWIAPVWIFFAVPILLLHASFLLVLPHMVRSLFTADRHEMLLPICELALGIAFLFAYPRGTAWGSHVKAPCIIAGFLSVIAIVLWLNMPQSFNVSP